MALQTDVGGKHWSLRAKGFRTHGGALRSCSDAVEGAGAPATFWSSLGASSRTGPPLAISSATCVASFPELHRRGDRLSVADVSMSAPPGGVPVIAATVKVPLEPDHGGILRGVYHLGG